MIRRRAHLALLDDGKAGYICDALQLGCALGSRNTRFPAQCSGREIERQKFAACGAREQPAATDNATGYTPNRERRIRSLVDPLWFTVRAAQCKDLSVDRPGDGKSFGDHRRAGDFAGNFSLPQRLADRIKSKHVSLIRPHDDQI